VVIYALAHMTVAEIDARLGRVRHIGARIRNAAVKPTLAVKSAPQGTVVVAAVSITIFDGRTGQNSTVVVHYCRAGVAHAAVCVGRTALEAGRYEPVHKTDAHAVGVASAGLTVSHIVRTTKLNTETASATLVAIGVFAWRTRTRTVSVNLAWPARCSTYELAAISARRLCARYAVRTDGTGATAATSRITVTVEVSTTKVFTIVVHAGTCFDVLPKRTGAKATVKVTATDHGALAVGGTFRPTSAIAFA